MIIRKIFESVDFYEKTTSWKVEGQNSVRPISSTDRDRLVWIFPLRKPIETNGGRTSRTKLIFKKGAGRIDIDILTDDDEWFYVRIITKYDKYGSSVQEYFKCDQFDGLSECIKREVIEK